MVKATKSVNYFRERHGIPAIKIDAQKAQAAHQYLTRFIMNRFRNRGGRRRLEEEEVTADTSNCGQNLYEAPADIEGEVTSDMAVAEWYS